MDGTNIVGAINPSLAITLEPGQALVIYTDGVTDAVNESDEDYGLTRMFEAIRSGPASAQDMVSHLMGDLSEFSNGAPQTDDITLLVLNR